MNTRTLLTIVTIALLPVLFSVLGWLGRGYYEQQADALRQVDTVYAWVHDTVKIVESKNAGTVAVKLPVYIHDTTVMTEHFRDTTKMIIRDSVQVEVPIEQRTYEGDNYRAVVQGFKPELLSIDIRLPEIAVSQVKRKWWSVTAGPQVGYGFTPAGWQPYAGVGVSVGICF